MQHQAYWIGVFIVDIRNKEFAEIGLLFVKGTFRNIYIS